jgi:hypothetical protein
MSMSLIRIGVMTAQMAVSPTTAAQTTLAEASQQAAYVLEKVGYLKGRGSENGSSAFVGWLLAAYSPGGGAKTETMGTDGF